MGNKSSHNVQAAPVPPKRCTPMAGTDCLSARKCCCAPLPRGWEGGLGSQASNFGYVVQLSPRPPSRCCPYARNRLSPLSPLYFLRSVPKKFVSLEISNCTSSENFSPIDTVQSCIWGSDLVSLCILHVIPAVAVRGPVLVLPSGGLAPLGVLARSIQRKTDTSIDF